MKSGILIAAASVLMVSVWGAFFYVFFSQPEPSLAGHSQPEREAYETVRFIETVDTVRVMHEETEGEEEFEAESTEHIRPERRYTKDPSELPETRHGDAIGFGEGVSVDDLLNGDGTFDN